MFCTEPFFIGRVFRVLSLDREKFEITGRAWGESFDLKKHPAGTEIKAITYSNMQINENQQDGNTHIYVIVDI
jgi:SHS2 domain-containing protein